MSERQRQRRNCDDDYCCSSCHPQEHEPRDERPGYQRPSWQAEHGAALEAAKARMRAELAARK